jgi:hypothetical protein
MTRVDPRWSLDALLRDYDPQSGWRRWFTEAYTKALESGDPDERLDGWRIAAVIFGDMHVPVFCLFVCYHGRALEPPGRQRFLAHIDLCLWDLGLATPARPDAAVPPGDLGKPDGFRRDEEATAVWLAEQLRPFWGDVGRAAVFAMRLTAARFGLLRGPAEPSVAQVLDESLWERVRGADPAGGKRWWQFWK